MKTKLLEKNFLYDGSQLRSLFGYMDHDLLGDSIICWKGPCDVTLEHMIDGEDKRENAKIAGAQMLHFIIEKFNEKLSTAVALQRLFATILRDEIYQLNPRLAGQISRQGDDLYWEQKKLSISVATASPISVLIHFAVNVTNEGTPVPTCALSNFDINPKALAERVLRSFADEIVTIT